MQGNKNLVTGLAVSSGTFECDGMEKVMWSPITSHHSNSNSNSISNDLLLHHSITLSLYHSIGRDLSTHFLATLVHILALGYTLHPHCITTGSNESFPTVLSANPATSASPRPTPTISQAIPFRKAYQDELAT